MCPALPIDPWGLAPAQAANGRTADPIATLPDAARRPTLSTHAAAVAPRLGAVRHHRDLPRILAQLRLPAS